MKTPDDDKPPGRGARPPSRSYPDPCGIARALNLIGERWALLVIRELILGPKRFSDLRAGLPAISPNVLSQRLDELVSRGLVQRLDLGPPVSGRVYELTDLGASLEPVLTALAVWGSRAVGPGSEGELSTDALILALRTTTRVDPGRPSERFALRLGNDLIFAEIGPTGMTATRRPSSTPARATIDTDTATLRAVAFGDEAVHEVVKAGRIRIGGDEAAAHRFLAGFARPQLVGTDAGDPTRADRAADPSTTGTP